MRCDRTGWAGVRARDREAVYIVGRIGARTQCPARVNSLAGFGHRQAERRTRRRWRWHPAGPTASWSPSPRQHPAHPLTDADRPLANGDGSGHARPL